ncbi:Uncharacterised protein [Mycobacterium tuberculosis]|nr:Uncharacterised protein [Mycobacterium tuberculosis]
MTLPAAEWGTSLTERITAAFEAGDRERCGELIAGGDGRSRDLAQPSS